MKIIPDHFQITYYLFYLILITSTKKKKEIEVRQNLTLIVPFETSFENILKTHFVQRNLKDKILFVKLSVLQIQQTVFDIIRRARSIIKTTFGAFSLPCLMVEKKQNILFFAKTPKIDVISLENQY